MPTWLTLALVISAACLPGIALMAYRGVRSLSAMTSLGSGLPPDPESKLPSPPVLMLASGLQNLLGVAGLAAAGCWALGRAGLDVPVIRALVEGAPIDALAAIGYGAVGALTSATAVLALYYGWARRTIDVHALARIEHMRIELGIATRVLFAGMSEEVLFRLGVMTLLAWGFGGETGGQIAAIAVSSLIFAAAHVPAIVAAGVKLDGTLVFGTLGLNTIAGAIFGVLFWKVGLVASMIAHAGFHLLWWPLEARYQTIAPPEQGFEWIGDGRISEGG